MQFAYFARTFLADRHELFRVFTEAFPTKCYCKELIGEKYSSYVTVVDLVTERCDGIQRFAKVSSFLAMNYPFVFASFPV